MLADGGGVLVCEWVEGGPVPVALSALHRIAELAGCLGEVPAPAALGSAGEWLRSRLVTDPVDVVPGSARPSAVQRTGALRELDELSGKGLWTVSSGS